MVVEGQLHVGDPNPVALVRQVHDIAGGNFERFSNVALIIRQPPSLRQGAEAILVDEAHRPASPGATWRGLVLPVPLGADVLDFVFGVVRDV